MQIPNSPRKFRPTYTHLVFGNGEFLINDKLPDRNKLAMCGFTEWSGTTG